MSRALRFTLLIGGGVAFLLAMLHAARVLESADRALAGAFGLPAEALAGSAATAPLVVGALLAFGMAWAAIDIHRFDLKAVVSGSAVVQLFTGSALAALFGAWFSPFLPSLAVALAYAAGALYSRTEAGQRARQVEELYGRRISDGAAAALTDDARAPLDAQGRVQELSIVVCEIFNHPELMQELPPGEYTALLNEFLELASESLVADGGCLVECDGEGARAIFGAPLPAEEHARAACLAGLNLARRLNVFNEKAAARHSGRMADWRIGVNSGLMITGHFGGERLAGFGAAGEEVEFARRLCAANLIYGSGVLIGARTYEMAEGAVEVRPMELLRRRQDENWQEVYELLGLPEEIGVDERDRRDLYWNGVIYYREKRLAEALEIFQRVRALSPSLDGPVEFYVQRIRSLMLNGASADFETARLLNSL